MNHLELSFDDEAGKRVGALFPRILDEWMRKRDERNPYDHLVVVTEGSELHRKILAELGSSAPQAIFFVTFEDVQVFLTPREYSRSLPGVMRESATVFWRQAVSHVAAVAPAASSPSPPPQPMTAAERRAARDPSYQPGRTAEGMRNLRRKFGHHYKGVDVEAFVRDLRAD